MKKNIILALIFSCLLAGKAFADQVTIVCPSDSKGLSAAFESKWEKYSTNWFSFVQEEVTGSFFEGSLHTLTDQLPIDQRNPNLNFVGATLTSVPHYDVWQITCLYHIGNPLMKDVDDEFLHLNTSVNLDEYPNCTRKALGVFVCSSAKK